VSADTPTGHRPGRHGSAQASTFRVRPKDRPAGVLDQWPLRMGHVDGLLRDRQARSWWRTLWEYARSPTI